MLIIQRLIFGQGGVAVTGEDSLEVVQEGPVRLPIFLFQQLLDDLFDRPGVALLHRPPGMEAQTSGAAVVLPAVVPVGEIGLQGLGSVEVDQQLFEAPACPARVSAGTCPACIRCASSRT